MDALGEFLSGVQWAASQASTFGITPDQLIGVEVGRVAWQKMQGQLAPEFIDIAAGGGGLVRGQVIEH